MQADLGFHSLLMPEDTFLHGIAHMEKGTGSTPAKVGNILEIFSRDILSLPMIQEGQLSVSGERMCTMLVNRLED